MMRPPTLLVPTAGSWGPPGSPASAQQAWDREGITRSQLGPTAGLGLESSAPRRLRADSRRGPSGAPWSPGPTPPPTPPREAARGPCPDAAPCTGSASGPAGVRLTVVLALTVVLELT